MRPDTNNGALHAFLDGHEPPARREQGWGSLLDSLGQWLQSSRSDGS